MHLSTAEIKSLTDLDLVAQYRQTSDKDFVGELFRRYSHLVYGVCMKYFRDEDESKDAMMQVFEKLFSDLHKYQVSNFKSWLYSVAKNYCLMQLRGRHMKMVREDDMNYTPDALVESQDVLHLHIEKEKTLTILEEGITQLNEEQQVCIRMFFIEEKCYNEIADITGYSLKEVKSYLQNGKRNLKIFMTEKNATG